METIHCRVKRSLWWLAFACVPAGAFFLDGPFQIAQEEPKSSPWPLFFIFGPMVFFFWVGAIYFALSLVREEIIADETGLRWRGAFGPWKGARWEEVSDFYLSGKPTRISPVQTSPSMTRPTVETPHGKLKLEQSFTNLNEMMAFIAAHATNALAREWEIFELRASQNFSQRFIYWTKTQTWTAPIQSLGAVYVAGFVIWGVFFSENSNARAPYGMSWALFLIPLLLGIALFGSLAALFVVSLWMMWRDRNFAGHHRNESLEISQRGLAWQNGETRIEANWDEVRAITAVPGNGFKRDYRVETQNGDFTVWKSLDALELWLRFVRQFAPHVAPDPVITDPDLGSEAATWSGARVGSGARVFHFRTRDTRLVLIALTAFGLALPLLPLLMQSLKTPDDAPSSMPGEVWWVALLISILALIYLWLCFRRAAIWADETGLEWRVPLLKTRRVNWSEIEGFGRDESGFFIQTAGKKRKLWQVSAPVRQNELLQLIAQRATNATGKWVSI